MITVIRTTTFIPGKTEAFAIANEIAKQASRVLGRPVRVGTPIGANLNGICWIAQFDSLAQMEEGMSKIPGDAQYMAAVKSAEGVWVPGSLQEQLFRTN